MATKIRHACGHEVEYAALKAKDRKAAAARPCFACEYAARQARGPAGPVYCVAKPHPGCIRHIHCRAGGTGAILSSEVRELPAGTSAPHWETYPTREAAEARVRDLVAAGAIEIIEDDDPEGSEAVARTMGLMAEIDRAERPGPVPCERSRAAALDRAGADPDDEREIDLVFGGEG